MRSRTSNLRAVAVAAILSILVLLVGAVINGPADEVGAQGATADYFLKIEGIEGESLDEQHPGEIEVQSWSWGESNSTRPYGSSAGVGKVSMRDFHFTMPASKASPKLFLACAQGKIIPSATLTGATADGTTFIKWEFKDVIISNYVTNAEQVAGVPTDEIKLRYGKVTYTYIVQNADGTKSEVRAGWDLGKAKSI